MKPPPGVKTQTDMPPKVIGRHRWVIVCSFLLTDEQAKRACSDRGIDLGPLPFVDHVTACYDCEQAYKDVAGKPCPSLPVTH